MSIELRILGGARAGQSQTFEKSVIALGRHPMSDLQFDTNHDLDVSARHGEIRALDDQFTIYDQQSTNGTFVNGERLASGGSRVLRDGDVIAFGAQGPTVQVCLADAHARTSAPAIFNPSPIGAAPAPPVSGMPAGPAPMRPVPARPVAPRLPTSERIAIAVHEQTRGLRVLVVAVVIVLGGLAAGIFVVSRRDTKSRDEEIATLIATAEQASKDFQTRLQGMDDTALTNGLKRRNDSLTNSARTSRGTADVAAVQVRLRRDHELQQKFSKMDLPAVRDANDSAIVLLAFEIGGRSFEATGFSVSHAGLIVTNRHVVSDSGVRATRIGVKFANTRRWLPAHVVRIASDSAIDLALIQVDEAGKKYPAVRGVAASVDTPVGGAIASLGFPEGTDLPMEGSGNNAAAKTTLTIGTVSKLVSNLLQIDSFATHGSSGSPVFDEHAHVIGVIWGGPVESAGRIVFAVRAERITEMLRAPK